MAPPFQHFKIRLISHYHKQSSLKFGLPFLLKPYLGFKHCLGFHDSMLNMASWKVLEGKKRPKCQQREFPHDGCHQEAGKVLTIETGGFRNVNYIDQKSFQWMDDSEAVS